MKYLWILYCTLTLGLLGCATRSGNSWPKQRPDDFAVTYKYGGVIQDKSELYYISRDSCVRESRFEGHFNRWTCKTDPKKLDALYALIVKDDVSSIQSENIESAFPRDGITLRFNYGNKKTEIQDAGLNFVVEKDIKRFMHSSDAVVSFVDEGLQSQTIPVQLDLRIEVRDSAIQSCFLMFDYVAVMNWKLGESGQLTRQLTFPLLPGQYVIIGTAEVGSRLVVIRQPVQVDVAHHSFQLLLKNESFELVE